MDAPAGLLPLPRPLMISEVLDAAYRVFRAGLLRNLPYSALMVLILLLPSYYYLFIEPSAFAAFSSNVFESNPEPFARGVAMVLSVPLLGVLTLRLNALASGQRPRFRSEIATVLKRWPPALIATAGAFFWPVIIMFVVPEFTRGLTSEAYFFLSIPLYWPTALFVATLPVFWCDRTGPFEAIVRSVAISARRSWRMVGALLATLGVVTVFWGMIIAIILIVAQTVQGADLFLFATAQALAILVAGAFGVPFLLAMLIVLNRDLDLRHFERKAARA